MSPRGLGYGVLPAFRASLALVWLVWLPLIVLPVADGMLFVATSREVARDLGLLWLLAVLPVLAYVLLGSATRVLLVLLRMRHDHADLAAWTLALGPLLWLTVWQGGRSILAWARAISGEGLHVSHSARLLAITLLVAVAAIVLRRAGFRQALTRTITSLQELTWMLWAALLLACIAVLQLPPRLVLAALEPHGAAPGSKVTHPRAGAPDIFLISLDALAVADARPCDLNSPHMPRLAAFSAAASCFTRFHAASNFTTAATATMETGLLPWTHHATQPDAKMVPWTRSHSIARHLRQHGYRTHFLSDNFLASPRHRGTFDAWDTIDFLHSGLIVNRLRDYLSVFPETDLPRLAATAVAFFDGFERWRHAEHSPYSSERTYSAALARLDQGPAGQPTFMWVHTLPPHAPYLAPASTKYQLLPPGQLDTWSQLLPDNIEYAPELQPFVDRHRLRYQESIRSADIALGAFLDELDKRGRLANAVVLITADHGESFELGFLGHAGPRVDDALLRVPLVVKLPGGRRGQVIDRPVSQADLAPTIAALAGVPDLPHFEGSSLQSALHGDALPERVIFAMSMEKQDRFTPITRGRFLAVQGPNRLEVHFGATGGPTILRVATASDSAASARSGGSVEHLRQSLEASLSRANAWQARSPAGRQ